MTTGNFTSELTDDTIKIYMGNPYDADELTANEARLILHMHKSYLRELMTELHKYLKA